MNPIDTELVYAMARDKRIVKLILELQEYWDRILNDTLELAGEPTNHLEAWLSQLREPDNRRTVERLKRLASEILEAFSTRLIEEALERNQWQKQLGGFTLIRGPHCIELVEPTRMGEEFFRFGLWGNHSDWNYFFGVKGPWEKFQTLEKEVFELKALCQQQLLLKWWRNWVFAYPRADRKTVYLLVKQDIHPRMVFDTYVKEFLEKCKPLVPSVQAINKKLILV